MVSMRKMPQTKDSKGHERTSKRVPITVDCSQYASLKAIASREDLSFAAYVRKLIREFLSESNIAT